MQTSLDSVLRLCVGRTRNRVRDTRDGSTPEAGHFQAVKNKTHPYGVTLFFRLFFRNGGRHKPCQAQAIPLAFMKAFPSDPPMNFWKRTSNA
jgi:hypothetical protein